MGIKNASIMPVLAVDDVDRATAFYRDKLGFEVRRLADDPSGGVIVQIGERDRLFLYKTTFPRGENTVASLVVDDVESTVRELRGRGVTFEEYDLPGLKTENGVATYGEAGMKAAWFKDSEGNTISVNPDLEEALRKVA
jgi:catechol 2,3-dioxygenase-like lactoylglutathione lyase family enzyme